MEELKEVKYHHSLLIRFFEIDPVTLRDIYILDTTPSDWDTVLNALRSSEYGLEYLIDSNTEELPNSTSKIFNNDSATTLKVKHDNIHINSHFFSEDEIDFDMDPRDIVAYEQIDDIIDFMKFISNAVNKESILTPEMDQSFVLVKVFPRMENIWIRKEGM